MATRSAAPDDAERPGRVLAHLRSGRPGPSVVVVGGLHGNEPAGVQALQRVAARLPSAASARGELLLAAGNTRALAKGVRYLESDMNRGWWPESLSPEGGELRSEDEERRELLALLEPLMERASRPVIVVDLHTTSGDTPPFITLGDTLRNRRFASAFPLPVVLGLEEQLAGTFLEYVNNRGCITLGCEGGRHDDPAAVDALEAATWIALLQGGILTEDQLPDPDPRQRLAKAASRQPDVVEVRYRHEVPPGRAYTMAPGFRSFQWVGEGELLGEWEDGERVVAPERGRILMPLYQNQGDDGFFIVRDVRRAWLRLSAILRRMRADRVATLLPGVRPHPYMANAVIVDRRVARWLAVEVFHLLGFRRRVEQGHELIMARRHFDRPDDWR